MKYISLILLMAFSCSFSSAQKYYVDSLHHQLNNSKEDTTRVLLLSELGNYYGFNQFDSAIFYGQKAIDLSNKLNYPYGHYRGLKCLFFAYNTQGNYPKALEITLQNVKVGEKIRQEKPEAYIASIYCLGVLNRQMNNFPIAIEQLQSVIKLYKDAELPHADMFPAYSQLALIYQQLQRLDSALWFAQKGYDIVCNRTCGQGLYVYQQLF
jgi:tetratricopeptide (TPR) repeat protein